MRQLKNCKKGHFIELLKELSTHQIYLVDVVGGKMWYNEETKKYSWDVNEFIKGYSQLNRLAVCFGN